MNADSEETKKDKINAEVEIMEENYKRLEKMGGTIRERYEKVFLRMVNVLQREHIEELLQIVRKHEKCALKNVDTVLDQMRTHIASQLIKSQEKFWQQNEVDSAIVALEMCKEKFKPYESIKDWDVNNKTPDERIRSVRVRLKETRLRCMKARLELQRKQLEEETVKNVAIRRQLEDVTKQRVYLLARMERLQERMVALKPEIKRLQSEMLK